MVSMDKFETWATENPQRTLDENKLSELKLSQLIPLGGKCPLEHLFFFPDDTVYWPSEAREFSKIAG
jgi:hypothetical protein